MSIAFRKCNGDANLSFKEHLKTLYKSKEDYETGFVISGVNNYILTDIEKLLSKAILNICSADYLIRKGYFSWGFVTSYYANFFLIQGLNRTKLDFTTWVDRSVNCLFKNYQEGTVQIKAIDRSTDEHQRQFQRFFENFNSLRNQTGIDRYWNIGIWSFELGNEPEIRNKINYEISKDSFYELDLSPEDFDKIIKDNLYCPFAHSREQSKIPNHSRKNLKLAICRLRMLTYILNFLAIRNLEYQSYYQRNMRKRLKTVQERYMDVSDWINILFQTWLIFDPELVDKDEIEPR